MRARKNPSLEEKEGETKKRKDRVIYVFANARARIQAETRADPWKTR